MKKAFEISMCVLITTGPLNEALPTDQQHFLKKMQLGHKNALFPTSPGEALEAPSRLDTYNPTTATQRASESNQSLTSLVITTTETEAQLDTLPPGRCKPAEHVRTSAKASCGSQQVSKNVLFSFSLIGLKF